MTERIETIESHIRNGKGEWAWESTSGELVRCKNCKAFNRFDSIINGRIGEHGACLTLVAKGTAFGDSIVHETHYCAWAERKENDRTEKQVSQGQL